MKITTTRYVRKPFFVDAVQVTAENYKDVAEWCNGHLYDKDDPKRTYIAVKVLKPLIDRQTKAFIGDWVLKGQDNGFKVYTPKAFSKSFDLAIDDTPRPVETRLILQGMARGLQVAAEEAATRQGESKQSP